MGQGGEFHNNLNLSSEMVFLGRANCMKIAKTGVYVVLKFLSAAYFGFYFLFSYDDNFLSLLMTVANY